MNSAAKKTETWSPEVQQRHLRWNYTAMIADGAAYTAGMAFVSAESVLPSMIKELGGADWLIALSPSFLLIGSMMTPLLMVHHVEKMKVYRPAVFYWSIIQRLVPLVSALLLLFGWAYLPGTVFWFVALTQFLQGLGGGLCSSAFWELYSKVIPANRRSSNSAWRNGIGLLVGIGAGYVISQILAEHPGRTGYAFLLLLQFAFLALSGVFFYMVREAPDPDHAARPHRSLREFLVQIPAVLAAEKNFRRFIWVRSLGQAHVIIIPFLALHFRKELGLPDNALGHFVQAQMFGGLLGNLLAGYYGDRLGARKPLLFSRLIALSLCVAVIFVSAPWAAVLCFFAIGLIININQVSENMLLLEIASPENRPALVAMQSLLLMPVTLGFGLASKWLFQATGDLRAQGLVAFMLLVTSFLILRRIRIARPSSPARSA